ncbi:hypothetical protein BKA93DRAFT_751510 [Sparassis latifolia]
MSRMCSKLHIDLYYMQVYVPSGVRQSTFNLHSIPENPASVGTSQDQHQGFNLVRLISQLEEASRTVDLCHQLTTMADLCKRTDQKQFQLRESRDDRGSIVYKGLYEDVNEDGQLKGEFLDDDSDRGETFLVNHNHTGSPPLSNDESKESDKLDNTKEEHKETIHQPLSYVPVSNVEEDIKEDVEEKSEAEAKDEDEDEASVPALPSLSITAAVHEHENSLLTSNPTIPPSAHAPKHQRHKIFQMA